ncbi:MAG: hypothetical protein SGARI_008141, partial [Bacillariaceae sp.]
QQQLKRQDDSHSRALAQFQKDNQVMQQKWNGDRDLVQSLRIEKQAADKKAAQLEAKLKQAEQKLLDSTSIPGLSKPLDRRDHLGDASNDTSATTEMVIPSLGNKIHGGVACVFCHKKVMMGARKCPCKKDDCPKRAHQACYVRAQTAMAATSLAAPGTPSIKRPVILCATSTFGTSSIAATAVTPAAPRGQAKHSDAVDTAASLQEFYSSGQVAANPGPAAPRGENDNGSD